MFDLDGTLVDTIKDIAEAVNYTLIQMGKEAKPLEYHRKRVGWGLKASLVKAVPEETEEFIDKAVILLENYYKNNPCVYTEAYEGIPELISRFQEEGLDLFVYTNKHEPIAESVVEAIFGPGVFMKVFGAVTERQLKPDKKAVSRVIEETGHKPEDILYIGDSEVDLETARAGNMDCLAVLWGFRTKEQLEDYPKMAYAETPDEVISLIF